MSDFVLLQLSTKSVSGQRVPVDGDVAQMVERMLSMHEAQGSIPCFSSFFCLMFFFFLAVSQFLETRSNTREGSMFLFQIDARTRRRNLPRQMCLFAFSQQKHVVKVSHAGI